MSTKGQRGGEHPGEVTLTNSPHAIGTHPAGTRPVDMDAIDMDAIDMNSIRDTLRYIASDLRDPRHAELRIVLELALMEIGRIEAMNPSRATAAIRGAGFLPADA